MTEYLFVYGTLMEPDIQKHVLGRTVTGQVDRLAGYRKESIRLESGVYPIIKPAARGSVDGLVLAISRAELEQVDRYEGRAYRRKRVVLASGRKVWVYQA